MMYPIILASGSPRRKEILQQVGIEFTVEPSNKEEISDCSKPYEYVMELSKIKAQDIADQKSGPVMVIGADTVVAVDNQILGKPKNPLDAVRMLNQLSGRTHNVYTGVTVITKDKDGNMNSHTFYEAADVTITSLSKEEIETYVESKEPMDKAGAYAIQGKFACFVTRIEGDYYSIVGLPIAHLYEVIKKMNK